MAETKHDYDRIRKELSQLAERIQNGEFANDKSNRELKDAIDTLKRLYDELYEDGRQSKVLITSVDREQAIQVEKNANIFYQLGQLERRLEELEDQKDKSSEKNRDLIEKIFMLILGGAVTYIFSMLN